jgi:hypothetical protein
LIIIYLIKLLVILFLTIAIYKNVVIIIDYIKCCFYVILNKLNKNFVAIDSHHNKELVTKATGFNPPKQNLKKFIIHFVGKYK